MSNFNLIPALYMQRKSKEILLRKTARNAIVIVAVAGLALLGARYFVSGLEDELHTLQQARSVSDAERVAYTDLIAQRQVLEERVNLLRGLRSGLTAAELIMSVERAVAPDAIWFSDVQVRRAGVISEQQGLPVTPAAMLASGDSASAAHWKVVSYMDIRGQAIDHSALSEFSRSLLKLAHVHEVNLQRSTLSAAGQGKRPLVNFDLSIVVRSGNGSAVQQATIPAQSGVGA